MNYEGTGKSTLLVIIFVWHNMLIRFREFLLLHVNDLIFIQIDTKDDLASLHL